MSRQTAYARHSRRQKPIATSTILLAVGAGLLALSLAVVGGLVFLKATNTPSVAAKSDPATKVYTRDEFRALVIGKTPEEVIAAVGRPTFTSDNNDGTPRSFSYYHRVMNPSTAKPDSGIARFSNGICVEVAW